MNSYSDCLSQPILRINSSRIRLDRLLATEIWLLKVRNAFANAGWRSIVPSAFMPPGDSPSRWRDKTKSRPFGKALTASRISPVHSAGSTGERRGFVISVGAQIPIELLMHVQDDLLLVLREPGVLESVRVHAFLHARNIAEVLPRNEQNLLGVLKIRHRLHGRSRGLDRGGQRPGGENLECAAVGVGPIRPHAV